MGEEVCAGDVDVPGLGAGGADGEGVGCDGDVEVGSGILKRVGICVRGIGGRSLHLSRHQV